VALGRDRQLGADRRLPHGDVAEPEVRRHRTHRLRPDQIEEFLPGEPGDRQVAASGLTRMARRLLRFSDRWRCEIPLVHDADVAGERARHGQGP